MRYITQHNTSLRIVQKFAMPLVAGAIWLLGGCITMSPPDSAHRPAAEPGDSAFEHGANQPPNARTMYALAKLLVDQHRDREAVYLLTRVLQEFPEFVPAYNEMAGIYLRSERINDAVTLLTAGLRLHPGDAVLHNNLGMCRLFQQNYEDALEHFHAASVAVPEDPSYRANEAAALAMLGRPAEAAAQYRGIVADSDAAHNIAVLEKAYQAVHPELNVNPAPPPTPTPTAAKPPTPEPIKATATITPPATATPPAAVKTPEIIKTPEPPKPTQAIKPATPAAPKTPVVDVTKTTTAPPAKTPSAPKTPPAPKAAQTPAPPLVKATASLDPDEDLPQLEEDLPPVEAPSPASKIK